MAYSVFHWLRKREYLKRMTNFNLEDCPVFFFFKLKMPRENKHLYFLRIVGKSHGIPQRILIILNRSIHANGP